MHNRFVVACWMALLAGPCVAADCNTCHDDAVARLGSSVHGRLGCTECHTGRDRYPHAAAASTAKCSQCHRKQGGDFAASVHAAAARRRESAAPDCVRCHGPAHAVRAPESPEFHKAAPETCGQCHPDVILQYKASVHGQALARGVVDAPICNDCHGEHLIETPTRPGSLVSRGQIRETCGRCHANLALSRKFGFPADRLISYDSSFHGLAAKAGSQSVANCASCHGFHNILPPSDRNSTVNARNLPRTCGKCHQGAGSRFALGPVHLAKGMTEPVGVRLVRQAYLVIIPLTIGFMLLHNLGDWFRKIRGYRFNGGEAASFPVRRGGFRMCSFERLEHAVLVLSFFTLAWSGFALRYPGQWWNWPLSEAGSARGTVHRTAAALFIAVAIVHLVSLLSNARLRTHWKEMLPGRRDLVDLFQSLAFNLGAARTRPLLPSFSYVEKIEYWAVFWTALAIGGSGLLLWANGLVLRLLPKEVLDIATGIHFYEAVLASLAVLIWHLYVVMFDPAVYPMNPAWITGRDHPENEQEAAGARLPSPAEAEL